MKITTALRIVLFTCAVFGCNAVRAQALQSSETNLFRLAVGGFENFHENAYYEARLHLGEPIPEILPASQDSEGHWSQPTDGFQLSLRFRQAEYLSGEPVPALVILRNLEPRDLTYWRYHEPYEFTLSTGTNVFTWKRKPKKEPWESNADSISGPSTVPKGFEIMQVFRVDKLFDIGRPGKYTLQVHTDLLVEYSRTRTNLVSGTTTFEIVTNLSPATIAATNAYFQTLQRGATWNQNSGH